ncbi:heme ABC transporter ATP-binding protein [Planktotalea sp.]|uniref:heme ABC transporter ATP-binding protein n=1 Tax=Planktotalea sp. TaxID=2029877 RepID=UPI0032991115
MTQFRASNIAVSIGRTEILCGADFVASAGELTAIVGPNGSGKTTLLKSLCNDLAYDGSIKINGTDIAELTPWDQAAQRAVLAQSNVIAFPFTVIEVVQIGLRAGTSGQHDDLPMQALRKVGLAHYAHRNLQELSGGEQQRAHLARVLAQVWEPVVNNAPRWLLLDEPVASLDIAHQLQVMRLAQKFAQAGGGVIAVMHDLNLTAMFADSIAVVAEGKVISQGGTRDVMTDDILSRAYGCTLRVGCAPSDGTPFVLPHVAQT